MSALSCAVYSPCGRYVVRCSAPTPDDPRSAMIVEVVYNIGALGNNERVRGGGLSTAAAATMYCATVTEATVQNISQQAKLQKDFAGFVQMTFAALLGKSGSVRFFVETFQEMKRRVLSEVHGADSLASECTSGLEEDSTRFLTIDYRAEFIQALFPIELTERSTATPLIPPPLPAGHPAFPSPPPLAYYQQHLLEQGVGQSLVCRQQVEVQRGSGQSNAGQRASRPGPSDCQPYQDHGGTKPIKELEGNCPARDARGDATSSADPPTPSIHCETARPSPLHPSATGGVPGYTGTGQNENIDTAVGGHNQQLLQPQKLLLNTSDEDILEKHVDPYKTTNGIKFREGDASGINVSGDGPLHEHIRQLEAHVARLRRQNEALAMLTRDKMLLIQRECGEVQRRVVRDHNETSRLRQANEALKKELFYSRRDTEVWQKHVRELNAKIRSLGAAPPPPPVLGARPSAASRARGYSANSSRSSSGTRPDIRRSTPTRTLAPAVRQRSSAPSSRCSSSSDTSLQRGRLGTSRYPNYLSRSGSGPRNNRDYSHGNSSNSSSRHNTPTKASRSGNDNRGARRSRFDTPPRRENPTTKGSRRNRFDSPFSNSSQNSSHNQLSRNRNSNNRNVSPRPPFR